MKMNPPSWTVWAAACLLNAGCDKKVVGNESAFHILVTDAGFEAPDQMAAGIRHIVFENRGSKIHEAMLIRLADGMSADDYMAAIQRGSLFPEGGLDYSGPGLTSPGETAEMWLRVDPGHYVLVCWNHSKTTHARSFTVNYTLFDDEVPKEDAVVKLLDYKFEIEGTLRRGEQVIRVETPGPGMHEADIFRLHDGKTVEDLRRWRKEDHPGPAPADALGGALDSHDIRRVIWLRKSFKPGRYAFHCEMPLTTDASTTSNHTSHSDLGMVREFVIKE